MKNLFLIFIFLGLLGIGAFFFLSKNPSMNLNPGGIGKGSTDFGNPKKPPHYESNVPEHASTLPAAPVYIVIYFNFDISSGSDIKVVNNGSDYGVGNSGVDSDKRTLRRAFSQTAPDGLYEVDYTACWPDGSCHDGNFKFAIDRSKASSFIDMTGQKEIAIHMKDVMFSTQNIRISTGTKITWINDEAVGHYINTDPHPGHNYYPDQNSELLISGAKYSFTFNQKGYFPYHCSAHPETMKGSIIVE